MISSTLFTIRKVSSLYHMRLVLKMYQSSPSCVAVENGGYKEKTNSKQLLILLKKKKTIKYLPEQFGRQ